MDANGTVRPATQGDLATLGTGDNLLKLVAPSATDPASAAAAAKAEDAALQEEIKAQGAAQNVNNRVQAEIDVEKEKNLKQSAPTSSDSCAYSATLDGNYACDATKMTVTGAQITNQATQVAGAAATQLMGQANLAKASEEGTQSALMNAGADTQIAAGQAQAGIGTLNAALGAVQLYQAYQHTENAKNIKAGLNAANFETGKGANINSDGKSATDRGFVEHKGETAKKFEAAYRVQQDSDGLMAIDEPAILARINTARASGNEAVAQALQQELETKKKFRDAQAKKRLGHVQSEAGRVSQESGREQTEVSKVALAGGITSLVTGAQQMAMGGASILAGNAMKEAAKKLQNVEGEFAKIELPGANGEPGDPTAPSVITPIGGSGAGDSFAATDENFETTAAPDLGKGFNPNPNNDKLNGGGPLAGKFTPGGASGGGASGAGAPGGGLTAAAAGSGDENAAARLGSERTNQDRYESSGGVTTSVGGGGGSAGPDLSGMLAQFLPKKEDDAAKNNGLLDFAGGRGPAADGNESLLDKNADIFQRIHQTYQEKQQKRVVGL